MWAEGRGECSHSHTMLEGGGEGEGGEERKREEK